MFIIWNPSLGIKQEESISEVLNILSNQFSCKYFRDGLIVLVTKKKQFLYVFFLNVFMWKGEPWQCMSIEAASSYDDKAWSKIHLSSS